MAENVIKAKGPTKRNQPGGSGANPQMVPLFGVVKDNVDPTRAGRIFVYLANNSGLDPEDRSNWRPVKFLSPFYGYTRGDAAQDNFGNFKNNPSSYGMWAAPPDIGTTVLCLFVNGDLNYGFYIGCVPEPEAMQMLPAIGATDNIVPNKGEANSYGGALRLPVTNINKNNKAIADTADYLTAPKPVHSYSSAIMFQQGVLRDPVRGPISSSSQRETPSRVGWGVSTPGRPIYEGGFDDKTIAQNLEKNKDQQLRVVSRRGGHTIVMDDGDIIGRDNLIRIRTSLGHQILMSDDGQTLMLLHSNGQSYIELGKEGTVDIYSTNSINLRTQGDLNLHADNDINIHATKNLNLQGENIHLNSEKEYKQRVGSNYSNFTMGKHTTKVTGAMSMESAGDISMASSAIAYVNGSKVNLNSGQTGTKPAEVPAIEKTMHTDTLFDSQKGFLAAPAKLVSITSRAPAHTPWANAGQGVDVKTSLDSGSNLPASPSTGLATTNATAASAGVSNPVTSATTASAPATSAASPAMNKNMTSAMVGQVAASAANGPLANAVTRGTAIAQTAAGTQVGIGQFAQTPQQLEQSGILKPGAASLVTSLAASTGNVQAAMTDNLFTGKPGAQNLQSFVQNVQAQTDSVVKNLQTAQTQLQNSGAIVGNESGTQLGGMILSTAQNGLGNTLGAMKSASQSAVAQEAAALAAGFGSTQSQALSGNLGAGLKGKVSGVMKDIAAGNFAAKLGEGGAGALSGLQNSVDSMAKSPSLADAINQSAGVAAGAFSAIASSLKPMQAGVPQNLTELAKQASETTASASESAKTSITSQIANSVTETAKNKLDNIASRSISGVGDKLSGGLAKVGLPNSGSVADSLVSAAKTQAGSITGAASEIQSSVQSSLESAATTFANPSSLVTNPSASVESLASTAKTIASGVASSTASSVASGLSNLPGGASAAASVTNLAKSAVPNLPGTADLKNTIKGAATDALNNIGSQLQGKANDLLNKASSKAGGLASMIPKGLPAGAASALQSAMGSIAAAGSGIKMPSIAVNTTNRSGINAAVTSQLDDPGIPAPNFGEVDEAAKSQVESIAKEAEEKNKKYFAGVNELIQLSTKRDKAQSALDKARKKLPQGDPEIAKLQNAYNSAYYAWSAKIEEVSALDKARKA